MHAKVQVCADLIPLAPDRMRPAVNHCRMRVLAAPLDAAGADRHPTRAMRGEAARTRGERCWLLWSRLPIRRSWAVPIALVGRFPGSDSASALTDVPPGTVWRIERHFCRAWPTTDHLSRDRLRHAMPQRPGQKIKADDCRTPGGHRTTGGLLTSAAASHASLSRPELRRALSDQARRKTASEDARDLVPPFGMHREGQAKPEVRKEVSKAETPHLDAIGAVRIRR